jgi:hypothetical protein
VQQKLSPTYDSTYVYATPEINATFDMRTAKVQDIEHGIAHSMKGSIRGFNSHSCSPMVKTPSNEGYHTLLTIEFVKNFLSFNIERNSNWKNYRVDRSRFQNPAFGFRLLDLEYILEGWAELYDEYYLNDISIVCNPSAFREVGIDEANDKLSLHMDWSCQGNLLGITPSPLLLGNIPLI